VGVQKYLGIYRAIVTNNSDPEGLRRLEVSVPEVFGAAASVWAAACVPAGSRARPGVGSLVWVQFEGGDPRRPVWVGVAVTRRR
jgi:hypothetical protein